MDVKSFACMGCNDNDNVPALSVGKRILPARGVDMSKTECQDLACQLVLKSFTQVNLMACSGIPVNGHLKNMRYKEHALRVPQ